MATEGAVAERLSPPRRGKSREQQQARACELRVARAGLLADDVTVAAALFAAAPASPVAAALAAIPVRRRGALVRRIADEPRCAIKPSRGALRPTSPPRGR